MSKGLLVIFLIIYIRNSACSIDVLYEIAKDLWKLYAIIDKITLAHSQNPRDIDETLNVHDPENQEIGDAIDKIHKQLNETEKLMYPKIIRDSFKLSSANVMLAKNMDDIQLYVSSIDEYYRQFHLIMEDTRYHSRHQLYNFLQENILNIQGQIRMIRKTIIKAETDHQDNGNLVGGIAGFTSNLHAELCDGPQVISNILIQLFRMVILAEVKAAFMIAFANMYLYSEKEGWKSINSFEKIIFEAHFANYVNLFTLNLDITDATYLRACDPAGGIWIRDKSSYELEGTFQATIFRYHWGVCKYGSCNNIQFMLPNRCESEIYDIRSSCSGKMAQCAYLSAIEACVLRNGPYKFQYVNSTALGALGRNFECPKDDGYLIEDGTGANILYAACVCNCFNSHNKISLSIMESQVSANKVITGLRFIRKNSILYIQPREGRLDGNGYISRYSEKWISIPHSPKFHSIDEAKSVFFLDDVRLPPYFALTGVKFNKVKRGNITGFAIEIFGSPFDYKSGKLNSGKKVGISKQISNNEPGVTSAFIHCLQASFIYRNGLSFKRINSLYTTLPHKPTAQKIEYLSLKRSELKDDFGQSTLPLFDAVPIRSTPPAILDGVGIFHKGVEGYAGFVSLRLYGLQYAEYFHDFKKTYMPDHRTLFNMPT